MTHAQRSPASNLVVSGSSLVALALILTFPLLTYGQRSAGEDSPEIVGPARIAGRILNAETENPVFDFEIELTARSPSGRRATVYRVTHHDEEGKFAFGIDELKSPVLEVRSSRHLPLKLKNLHVLSSTDLENLTLALDPGLSLSGRVLLGPRNGTDDLHREAMPEAPGLEPLAGVLVTTSRTHSHYWIDRGRPEYVVHTYTDEQGRFTLSGLTDARQRIAALSPDLVQDFVEWMPGTHFITLRPRTGGYRVEGTVLDDHGRPAEGILIAASGPNTGVRRFAFSDASGRYRLPPLYGGPTECYARQPPFYEGPDRFTEETRRVEALKRRHVIDFGDPARFLVWTGILRDEAGRAQAGARLHLSQTSPRDYSKGRGRGTSGVFSGNRSAVTDTSGRFEFRKLERELYYVGILRPDTEVGDPRNRIRPRSIQFETLGVVERDLTVPSGGHALEVRAVDRATGEDLESGHLWLRDPACPEDSSTTRIEKDNVARFEDLPAGEYEATAVGYLDKTLRVGHARVTAVPQDEGAPGNGAEPFRIETRPGIYLTIHRPLTGLTGQWLTLHRASDGLTLRRFLYHNGLSVILEEGDWTYRLRSPILGRHEGSLRIRGGMPFTLEIEEEDYMK